MSRTSIKIGISAAAGLAATLGVMAPPAMGARVTGTPASLTVIASHLDNPRGLSPAPGGGLYLAEAGAGGKTCVKGTCAGLTGSFDWIGSGGVRRLVTGLISVSGTGGVAAEGPASVSAAADGSFYGVFGLNRHDFPPKGFPASVREAAAAELGHLWRVRSGGSVQVVSDVSDHDYYWTKHHIGLVPPGNYPDANPNAVLHSDGHIYIADAAANTLVEVERDGAVKVLAFFPQPARSPHDSVPTCVARGPDGALYVGELLGGTNAPGHARVWRVVPGHKPTVWATGLTTIQGCGFGSGGAFYATEFQTSGFSSTSPAGDVVRISKDGHRTHLGVGQLFYPSGFAAGPDGSIYVSNCSIAPAAGMGPHLCPAGGQVVRIR